MSANPEIVRDRLRADQAAEMLDFWASTSGLDPAVGQRRLHDAVCLLREGDAVVGVSSVFVDRVPALGGRRLYVHRCELAADPALEVDLARASFGVLDEEFEPGGHGPIGLCLLLADAPWLRARPELHWHGRPRLSYAGHLEDGRQIRVAYFTGARVGERPPDA